MILQHHVNQILPVKTSDLNLAPTRVQVIESAPGTCPPSRRFLAQQVQFRLIGVLSRSHAVTRQNLREGCDKVPFLGGLGITLGSFVANHNNRTAMTTRHVIGAKSKSEVWRASFWLTLRVDKRSASFQPAELPS